MADQIVRIGIYLLIAAAVFPFLGFLFAGMGPLLVIIGVIFVVMLFAASGEED